MISISDIAAEKAKQILSMEKKPDWGLRIYVAGNSCCGPSFGMDLSEHPAEGDEIIENNGLKVFIDKNASEKLNGLKLDFIDDGERQGFVITGGQPPACSTKHNTCG